MALIDKLGRKAGIAAVINSPKELVGEWKALTPSSPIPAGAE
jgi:hypothetical protein